MSEDKEELENRVEELCSQLEDIKASVSRQNTPINDGQNTSGFDFIDHPNVSKMDKSVLDHDEMMAELETANQLLADKDLELTSVQKLNTDLDSKLQKIQVDFS